MAGNEDKVVDSENSGSGDSDSGGSASGATDDMMTGEGKVEICIDGLWSQVCGGNFWGFSEARVACMELGFSCMCNNSYRTYCDELFWIWSTDGVPLYRTSSHTGRHHHRFSCAGDESTLLRCNYSLCSGFGDDAGVICYNG